MIKVLQVMAALSAGGVETLLHSYYECINREKFCFDVACYSHANGAYREKYEELGCRIYALPSKKKLPQSIRTLYRVLKDGQYDIVHVHQDDLSFLPILIARLAGVKVRIVHSHLGRYPHSFLRKLITGVTNPLMFRLANGYFACSEKAKEEFYPERLQERVYVMPNGISAERFRFSPENRKVIRDELGFTDQMTVVGNIARITDQKDPLFLTEVFRKLHETDENYRLMLVGDGAMREQVEEKLRAMGLADAAVLTGERNDAYRYYSALDVFALPSAFEGLGISFVEAQTNGLPTFASTAVPRETKISDLIEYLPTGNSTELWAQRIRACGGRNGSKESEVIDHRFEIRLHVRGLEETYEKLLNTNQRGGRR